MKSFFTLIAAAQVAAGTFGLFFDREADEVLTIMLAGLVFAVLANGEKS